MVTDAIALRLDGASASRAYRPSSTTRMVCSVWTMSTNSAASVCGTA